MLALDCRLPFDPAGEAGSFAALPAAPAVFLLEPRREGANPYLARTADLRARLTRLLAARAETSKRLHLRDFAAAVRYRLTGSPFEQALVYYQHAKALFPRRYRELVRLRRPALLKVNLANEYPRCYVTRRLLADGGCYVGPFASRGAAESFASEFLNLFKIRRCQIKIRRDPAFPGCIYSEMKMCLAPCFGGCAKTEYDAEVGRVVCFLATGGDSLAEEIAREREAASEALDFERAAALHRRHEKLAGVLRGLPELARPLEELDAIVLQRAVEPNAVAFYLVERGMLADPVVVRFAELASQPRSLEQVIRDRLAEAAEALRAQVSAAGSARAVLELQSDHLSLLARWYYSKPRAGEIFFRAPGRSGARDWPFRRLLRACSRVLAGEQAAGPASAAAPESPA